jgi:ABC-type lipoprotein release transport system permease subunit
VNPLSPFTYFRRHRWQTALLVVLICLVTLGTSMMVHLLDSLTENLDILSGQLTRFSLVHPAAADSLDPAVVSQIRVHPEVAQAVQVQRLHINMPLGPATGSWSLLGVSEAEIPIMMQICGVRLREGRLPHARTNEIVLSEEIIRALKLEIGDRIGSTINPDYYGGIPAEMVLVGILQADRPATLGTGAATRREPAIRAGFASREYLEGHELLSRPSGLIVVAREGNKEVVDEFLETTILSSHTDVETAAKLFAMTNRVRNLFRIVCGVIECLVAIVIALVVGVINQIALTRRLSDLGLLHALGHQRKRLIRYMVLETGVVAGLGWTVGLAVSWLFLAWIKNNFYEPSGMELNLSNLTPIWFSLPVLAVVIGSAARSITQLFARLDSVAIIERGKLSMEQNVESRIRSQTPRSSSRPLSSWTFYLRHRRRGLMLVAAVAMMILGITFPMFLLSAMVDTQNPFLVNYLRHVGEVQPVNGRNLDPKITGQIRAHPAVARVIPAKRLDLSITIPPVGVSRATIYAVSEQDLPILVELFGMQLKEGRLPLPWSNEIVLSEALALNRGLHVGDGVGRPVYEDDEDIPSEMVVAGILASQEISLGLASQEYLESHELFSEWTTNLLVVPVEGRKDELDIWLEEHVAPDGAAVSTLGSTLREARQSTLLMNLLFAALEGVIVIVAATALTALNYIFFSQRKEEFGILHAVGRSRLWLTLRAWRESGSVVVVGWIIGAVLCMIGLVCAQAIVYGPRGLNLAFFSPSPWLFTLPVPLAVVAVSTGTIGRLLSRLDPVSIVEGRG